MNPNYEFIAKGYGIPYLFVTERKDLGAAVERMLATKGPFLLECAILEEDNVLPMTPPGMNVNQMMLEIWVKSEKMNSEELVTAYER